MKRRNVLFGVVVLVVVVAVCPFGYLLVPPFYLLFGWIPYLGRVVPQVRVDGAGVVTALVCVAGLAFGLHRFAGWLYSHNHAADPTRRWRWGWTAALLAVVVLTFAAGVAAVGVTHQTAWLFTSPGPWFESRFPLSVAQTGSANHLHQIGIAVAERVEQVNQVPPGTTFDAHGRALHGWQTYLLPYIEQDAIYKQIDLSVAWDQPRNRPAFQAIVKTYWIPFVEEERDRASYTLSHYAGNVHVFGRDEPLTSGMYEGKGAGNTILAGEVTSDFRAWGHPVNYRDPGLGLHRRADGFGGPFPGGTQFVMIDGSVVMLRNDISPEVLRQLATPGPKPDLDY
jgi:hypothetical protein